MKAWKIAGLSVLAVGMVLGVAIPTLADEEPTQPEINDIGSKMLVGKVTGVDAGGRTFTVETQKGDEYIISVDDDTEYFKVPGLRRVAATARERLNLNFKIREMPESSDVPDNDEHGFRKHAAFGLSNAEQSRSGLNKRFQIKLRPMTPAGLGWHQGQTEEQDGQGPLGRLSACREESSFDDITEGSRVTVRTITGDEGYLARLVLVIEQPSFNAISNVTGTVTALSTSDKTITIAPTDSGEPVVLNYGEKTSFNLHGTPVLEEGQSVRAVYTTEDGENTAIMVISPAREPAPAE